jgi:RNA polymerase sigma-70 factor (TIGR02943 family)
MENYKLIIEDWVNLYGDALYNWAISKTKNKELSEDLIQDTFIAALKSFESFENKSSPKTWLISILNNKIIDFYRKEKTKSFLVSEKNGVTISDLMYDQNDFWVDNEIIPFWEQEKELLRNEKFETELMKCCNELPEKWNLALTYKYFSDKKAVDICKELNITSTNYWQIIHRSKLVLKKCIEAKWNN